MSELSSTEAERARFEAENREMERQMSNAEAATKAREAIEQLQAKLVTVTLQRERSGALAQVHVTLCRLHTLCGNG